MISSPELRGLGSRLLDYRGATDDPLPSGGGFVASVALVLRPAQRSPELLLIRRAEHAGDPWSGHMAFPGGRRAEGDRSLLETAARETFEETGIALRDTGEVLGRLAPVSPRSPRLPPLSVVPFVFAVPAATRARASSIEVAETYWVPVHHFRAPGSTTVHELETGDETLAFPAFEVAGRTVWGLTHGILDDLLGRLS